LTTDNVGNGNDNGASEQPRAGYLQDYISGQKIRATPEEIDAVQVMAQRLVEDYDYDKKQIQTRPQFRVRSRPSDDERSFPVDIAVFRTTKRIEEELFLIVECKKKQRKEGIAQLKLYLDMSPAEIGVWFNGEEHVYLHKILHKNGSRTFEELPNIPRRGEKIADIGLYRRKDLKRPSNLKATFRDIRNHLAGNTTGITRDEALAQEIINLLFCKIYDELNTGQEEMVSFRSGVTDTAREVKSRIIALFDTRVKSEYSDVFSRKDTINLDAASIAYVVGELQPYCITAADRDAVGDAFEVFIGPALRGSEGQFFTPRNVVRMVIDMLNPEPEEMVIDPACGSGGFLIMALEHVWSKIERTGAKKGWSAVQIDRKKREIASRCFRGLDKDSFLAKVTKAYMAIIGDGRGGVFCENSLLPPSEWQPAAQEKVKLRSFHVVLTNPPFGTKIPVKGQSVLSQYDLGHKWKRDKETRALEKTESLHEDQPPQILFLERCLQLLRNGGRMGIVLPESILGNPSYEYVISFIRSKTTIRGIVTMPEPLFKTSGKGGTHCKVAVLLLEKKTAQNNTMFMADTKWCGHDSRGNPTYRRNKQGERVLLDDVQVIAGRYAALRKEPTQPQDHLGYLLPSSAVTNNILVPKYYNPEIDRELKGMSNTHDFTSLAQLVRDGAVSISTGVEIGKMAYGTGTIPFIRTSDLSNWEIKADFKHGVSQEIYEEAKDRADVLPGDILMVRDGTYLIGTTAFVTEEDVPMLFQSHLYRLRVKQPELINPYLLLITLNTPIVRAQIRAKQFTQDIIDTLGQRVLELVLPVPRDAELRRTLAEEAHEIINARMKLRRQARRLPLVVQRGHELPAQEVPADDDLLSDVAAE
jgi:type I restriction enzyme M protein